MKAEATLADMSLTVETLDRRAVVAIGSNAGLLNQSQADAVRSATADAGMVGAVQPVFTYLANSLRHADRVVPYSLVTATDFSTAGISWRRQPKASIPSS